MLHIIKPNCCFYGFENTSSPKFNWSTLKKNRDAYITRLNKLYFQNLENNKVEVLQGNAKFIDQNTIIVDQKKYTGKKILIAVGGSGNVGANLYHFFQTKRS